MMASLWYCHSWYVNYRRHSHSISLVLRARTSLRIFVKVCTDKTIILSAQVTDTIANLKAQIYEKENIPPNQQLLMYAGFELIDSMTLSRSHITNGATLHVALRRSESLPSHAGSSMAVALAIGSRPVGV